MSLNQPFIPKGAGGTWVNATTSATRIASGAGSESMCFTAPVTNTDTVYVRCGDSAVVATSADYPMLPGAQVSIGKFVDWAYVSLVSASGTQPVQVLPGIGI